MCLYILHSCAITGRWGRDHFGSGYKVLRLSDVMNSFVGAFPICPNNKAIIFRVFSMGAISGDSISPAPRVIHLFLLHDPMFIISTVCIFTPIIIYISKEKVLNAFGFHILKHLLYNIEKFAL